MRVKLARIRTQIERSVFFIPLMIIAAALMILISETAYTGAHDRLTELGVMGDARLELTRVLQRVTEAESAQRGFMLTGRKEYLTPFNAAANDARTSLTNLERMYDEIGHTHTQHARGVLQDFVRVRLIELQTVLDLHRDGQYTRAKELMQTGVGRSQMTGVRNVAGDIMESENRSYKSGEQQVFNTLMFNRMGVAAMTAISLLLLTTYMRQSRQWEKQINEQQAALQAERDRLESEVRRRTAELTELARHLQTVREDERARLARDLHDELGATLTTAKLDVARIRRKLAVASPDLIERLDHLTDALNSGIALKRRIIEDLRPSTLDQLGLSHALEILCTEFDERLDTKISVDISPVSLSPSAELTVFRLVQETLTNIAKYAKARNVSVYLAEIHGAVLLRIIDDGVGFDAQAVPPSTHGLRGMQFRVEAEQGLLTIKTAPGAGTRIEAILPLHEHVSAEAVAAEVAPQSPSSAAAAP